MKHEIAPVEESRLQSSGGKNYPLGFIINILALQAKMLTAWKIKCKNVSGVKTSALRQFLDTGAVQGITPNFHERFTSFYLFIGLLKILGLFPIDRDLLRRVHVSLT